MYIKDITHISKWLDDNDISYELNVDLAKKTWIKNGGIAQLFATPRTNSQLERLLRTLAEFDERFIVVGHTSNMFFSNSFDPSIIVSTREANDFFINGDKVICECGASLMRVAKTCVENGIAGYEGLVGIPGTVGAAVCNNSGAYDCEMSRLVERVEVLLASGNKVWLNKRDLEYSYRNSSIKSGKIKCAVLRVELSASTREASERLLAIAENNMAIRKEQYEGYGSNLGTVFSRMDICSGRILLQILLKIHRFLTCLLSLSIQNRTRNMLILAYFNELSLYPFISEKRINCFMWHREKGYKDEIFYDYLRFIKNNSSVKPILELQIIDETMELSGK